MQAVNPDVVNLNPSSANVLADVCQKSRDRLNSYPISGLTVYVEKKPLAWKDCFEEY